MFFESFLFYQTQRGIGKNITGFSLKINTQATKQAKITHLLLRSAPQLVSSMCEWQYAQMSELNPLLIIIRIRIKLTKPHNFHP